jgi:integrase/recombinase XerD
LIQRLCEPAGIEAKRISPHSVRHTFAIRALRAGASPVAAQKLLGHASLSTTSRYLDHLELGELREAVPELPT